jgi:hypothetical protein
MKQIPIAITALFIIGLTACNQKQNDNKAGDLKKRSSSAIEGNLITASYEIICLGATTKKNILFNHQNYNKYEKVAFIY